MNLAFFLCNTIGFLRVMYLVKVLLNIIRFVIPIILIAMVILDLVKNVIDPKTKDGIKKIYNRAIAAIIIFIIPTLINIVINFIGKVTENQTDTDYKVSACYINANMDCINNIQAYLDCENITNDRSQCLAFRKCNSYQLSNSCQITTVLDDKNCYDINYQSGNLDSKYIQFSVQGFKK